MITTVAVASVLLGATILSGGAAAPLAVMAANGLIGGGLMLGTSGAIDYLDNGRIDGTFKEYAGIYAGGFVTTAMIPAGAGLSAGKSLAWTGLSGATGSAVRQSISTGKVNTEQAVKEGAYCAGTQATLMIADKAVSAPYVKNGLSKFANEVKKFAADESGYNGSVSNGLGEGAGNTTKGWKAGDPIDNLTKAGNKPAWSTGRQRYWKNEAYNNSDNYSAEKYFKNAKGISTTKI